MQIHGHPPVGGGLRLNEKAIAPGAQTRRPGLASGPLWRAGSWPVRALLGG